MNNRRPHAFTLVELMLALAMLSLIGVGAAMVLTTAGKSTLARQDIRRFLAQEQALDARLSASIRGATQILSLGSNHVVLWKGDQRPNAQPNLSELQRIEWSNDGRLISYQAPEVWTASEAADTAYDPASDFNAVTSQLKSSSYFPAESWATNVTAIAWIIRGSDSAGSTILGYRLTLSSPTDASVSDQWENAVALRHIAMAAGGQ